MIGFRPSLDREAAKRHLDLLVAPRLPSFQKTVKRLNDRFLVYAATSPAPLPAPGLVVTPEIRCQSEMYLPIREVARCFNRLYSCALTYPPILSSTPFHNALSWADAFTALPPEFRVSANPARLLETLAADHNLLVAFLFASFLPQRFYGGFNRYPGQSGWLRQWLRERGKGWIRCLDAACGTGEDTYQLAGLLLASGFDPEGIAIEGWTIEPLEVWAAAHACFPHDRQRETAYKKEVAAIFGKGGQTAIVFKAADLLGSAMQVPSFAKVGSGGISPAAEPQISLSPPFSKGEAHFDLILCNGLLGGPIINRHNGLPQVVSNLAALLRPGGVLLAADHFHGGWKKQNPGELLGALCKASGMQVVEAGEGIAALK